jgi:spermidine dehydrogenase
MRDGITRRDFLNGVAIAVGAALAPGSSARGAATYPPSIGGMRGSTDDSYAIAHALRDGQRFSVEHLPIEGELDLVVVGAGISGLAAAHFFRQRRPHARILILDNHDDFGGHARRCEMNVDGRLLLSYGGSESIQSPHELWSDEALSVLTDLGVDLKRFESAFHRTLYPDLGLSRALWFPRETYGIDRLVTGDPTAMIADDIPPKRLNARSHQAFISDFPLDARTRQQLLDLYTKDRDFWPRESLELKMRHLSSLSYRDYLMRHWELSSLGASIFQMRPHDFFAIGIDLLPAFEAASTGYPGFDGLGLPTHPHDSAKLESPYIHHFPDGNASIARLLVRKLMPQTTPGSTMEDIVLAPFDYSKLDAPGTLTRLRLNSTVVKLQNLPGARVDVGYLQDGELRRVRAKHAIYAGYNMMLPYVLGELDLEQRAALAHGVKAPLVYVKVAVKSWRGWVNAGVHEITNTTGFHSRLKLDYPVSLGEYKAPRTPDEPMILHLVHVPIPANAADQRSAWRIGRQKLYETSFATFEAKALEELARMLGPKNFDPKQDVAAISVYRWGHGYAYGFNSLFDKTEDALLQDVARAPVGRITIANSDAAWSAYAHAAIDEAARAVRTLTQHD